MGLAVGMAHADVVKKKNVKLLNEFDLYSKYDKDEIPKNVIDYYDNLLDEIFPEELLW